MSIKQELYKQCQTILNDRLKVIQNAILDIQNSLQSETKSSAGDKHETGRAMLQLEREKAGNQLAGIQKQIELLSKINTEVNHTKVALGSVVKATTSNYFITVSVGEIKYNDESFYSISAATPIGKLLLSKSVNDTIEFKNQKFTITAIM